MTSSKNQKRSTIHVLRDWFYAYKLNHLRSRKIRLELVIAMLDMETKLRDTLTIELSFNLNYHYDWLENYNRCVKTYAKQLKLHSKLLMVTKQIEQLVDYFHNHA